MAAARRAAATQGAAATRIQAVERGRVTRRDLSSRPRRGDGADGAPRDQCDGPAVDEAPPVVDGDGGGRDTEDALGRADGGLRSRRLVRCYTPTCLGLRVSCRGRRMSAQATRPRGRAPRRRFRRSNADARRARACRSSDARRCGAQWRYAFTDVRDGDMHSRVCTQAAAATKIQSVERGRLTRRQLEERARRADDARAAAADGERRPQ